MWVTRARPRIGGSIAISAYSIESDVDSRSNLFLLSQNTAFPREIRQTLLQAVKATKPRWGKSTVHFSKWISHNISEYLGMIVNADKSGTRVDSQNLVIS
jgi:hypothetical protein